MFGNKLINTNAGGGCTNTVDLYNPFPDGGGVALYQLNGDATDVSGNYDGTATSVTYGAGEFGQAGVFNGSTSHIDFPSPIPGTNTPASFSGWFKFNSGFNSGVQTIIGAGNMTTSAGIITLYIRYASAGNYYIEPSRVYNNYVYYTDTANYPTVALSADTWYNVVFTYGASNEAKIYLNGSLISTTYLTIPSGPTTNSNILALGQYRNNTLQFNGSIDQVRLFNRALRPYEVEALYTEEYCTPTIVPSEHFNTVTYTGNGGTQSITGVGFQPDFVWAKKRSAAQDHIINDSVRGVQKELVPSNTSAEYTTSNGLSSFDSDGFTTGANNALNTSGATYASWNFKAGGAAVTNTDGTITSQVSANTEAGFSVVTFTGNGQTGATVGHGLGTAPAVVINKGRANLATYNNWFVWHKDLPNPNTDLLMLNKTDASASDGNYFGGSPTDSTLIFGNDIYGPNVNGTTYVNYVFAEVEGFSNFGSYAGTGASGNTVVTGFEPAFVMVKRTNGTGVWVMLDNKRNLTNPRNSSLYANTSAQEDTGSTSGFYPMNFYENGFEPTQNTGDYNASGGSYIYMAFAADPTTIEPSLEDSFNTVLYTVNGSTQTIGNVFEGGGSFNGSSSKIDLPNFMPSGNASRSVSMWINTTQTTAATLLQYGGGNTNLLFNLRINDGGAGGGANTIGIGFYANDFNRPATGLMDGNWHHIAATYDGTNAKIYIDGVQTGADFATGGVNTTASSGLIGSNGGSFIFNGSIDQVRIFNTALTAAQVTELYEETNADSSVCNFPSGAGGIALYELNGNANDTCGTYNGTATNVTWLNNGTGFQPDLVWIKNRDTTGYWHVLTDSVRGTNSQLFSNDTRAEDTKTIMLTSFNSNGFSVGTDASVNVINEDFVAWCWKGAELPAINSNGSIPSVVSANPAAGFSIVSYTGNGANGDTVGHGLSAVPNVVIWKNRSDARNWVVWHSGLTSIDYSLILNSTSAEVLDSRTNRPFGQPTDSVLVLGEDNETNFSPNKFIAYCFAEVAGFSKFGSYTGNGNAAGPTINCGFEPAFVMIKASSNAGLWAMHDNKRGNYSGSIYARLSAEDAAAEYDGYPTDKYVEFSATGFQVTTASNSWNGSGRTYIYMAFANQF